MNRYVVWPLFLILLVVITVTSPVFAAEPTPPVPEHWLPLDPAATSIPALPTATPGASGSLGALTPTGIAPIPITVRACVDLNGDRRCNSGEGIVSLPIVIVDAATGEVKHPGVTDARGHVDTALTLDLHTSLAVDVPSIRVSREAFPSQRGIDVVVPAPRLPEVLP